MKLKLLLIISVLALGLISTPVYADSSASITVIATGYVTTGPSGLVLTYVNDWEVGISWTAANGSAGTMVRAAYGHQPSSTTDGYLVYSGANTSCSDTAASLTSPEVLYYSAWSFDSEGNYSLLYETVNSEGIMSTGFLFLAWIILAIGLTWIATKVTLILFRVAPFLAWLGLGIWLLLGNITNLGIGSTWTQVLGFVFIVMAFGTLLLQIKTETKRNKTVMDNYGRQHVESFTDWAPKKRNKKPSSEDRQAAYKMKVRSAADRGRQRARGG